MHFHPLWEISEQLGGSSAFFYMHDVSQQVNLQVSMFTWLFNAVSSSLWVLQHFYVHNTERCQNQTDWLHFK